MNKLDELRQSWKSTSLHRAEIQQKMWDRAAENFGALPIPSFETNEFLQLIADSKALTPATRTLDVGCGSGIYSMALAPLVGEAVGVDISPNMIRRATERCRELELTNTSFQCLDWAAADLDQLGFREAFDVVFAHMTPAVVDFDTLDKLNACSRGLCLLEKPTRRRDSLQDAIYRLLGLASNDHDRNGSMVEIFSYLWYKGYRPQLFYHDDEWISDKSVDDTAEWYLDRIRMQTEVTPAMDHTVRGYLQTIAMDGLVHQIAYVTRVTVVWTV